MPSYMYQESKNTALYQIIITTITIIIIIIIITIVFSYGNYTHIPLNLYPMS